MRLAQRLGLALLALALAGPRRLAAVESFEAGLGNWTAAGLWHRVVSPACVSPHTGAACVYFGRDTACDYADGLNKDASLTSAPVALTNPAWSVMGFWLLSQVESAGPDCYDQLRLERSQDNGVSWSLLADLSPSVPPAGGSPAAGFASGGGVGGPALWQYHQVDLSAFLGLTLTVRFRFMSSAAQAGNNLCGPETPPSYDNYLGYALDDVSFGEAPPPLSLVKQVDRPFGAAGETYTYTLTVANTAAVPATLSVWDTLPAGAVFVGANPSASLSGSVASWSLPGVAAGLTATVLLQVLAGPSVTVPQDWINVAAAASSAGPAQVLSDQVLTRLRQPGMSLRKTVDRSAVTVGDVVQYNIVLENYTAVTQSAVSVVDPLPDGFVLNGAFPGFTALGRWDLGPLAPGTAATFAVSGPVYGADGQLVVNTASLVQAGVQLLQSSASLTLSKPLEPKLWLKGVYPNPAPSGKPGLPQGAFVAYELNMAMPVTLDIFTVAGEKVRHLAAPGDRGVQQAFWDLKNDWGADVASGVYAFRVWSSAAVIPVPEAFGFIAVLR